MRTFNLETRRLLATRRELISIETTDGYWPKPCISGIYLLLDSWAHPSPPDKFSVYMNVDSSSGLLRGAEQPGLRPKEGVRYCEWFDLEADADYSEHRRYNSQQESFSGGPALDGVWFRKDAFVDRKPPATMSIRLWTKPKKPNNLI